MQTARKNLVDESGVADDGERQKSDRDGGKP